MNEFASVNYQTAVNEFRRLRRQAAMQQLLARLSGRSADLLDYNLVVDQLQVVAKEDLGVQEIPLAAIVGSVGRGQDYTRDFLPKKDSDESRWVGIKTAVLEMKGIPPIDVYKIGEVYFVNDGNHRVSVMRHLGAETITAHVTAVQTKMPLTLEDDNDEIAAKVRYLQFRDELQLDEICPSADLAMTYTGEYEHLLAQIEAHRQEMQAKSEEPLPFAEVFLDWYEMQYMPVVEMLQKHGVMANFPRRTPTDLYMLVSEHRAELEEALGWDVDTVTAVAHLTAPPKQQPLPERILDAVIPIELEDGPEPGQWRKTRPAMRDYKYLFSDILVALRGRPTDWPMLDTAVDIARREKGRIHGLHVVQDEELVDNALTRRIQAVFDRRLENAGIRGNLVVDTGGVAETIIKWSTWNDLIVVGLNNPPDAQPLKRLGSGIIRVIQRSPIPVLFVPNGCKSPLNRMLLAYDGSPKSDEALFVAAYMGMRWRTAVTVITVETDYTSSAAIDRARAYLERHNVTAQYVVRSGKIAEAVLETAASRNANFIVMGGFGFRPVMHMMLGSTVDRVLREYKQPILVCR
jgi:nucleotide-binding universal stress UspA family protein/uncharacterized ParB-like nuclease family protein